MYFILPGLAPYIERKWIRDNEDEIVDFTLSWKNCERLLVLS